MFNFLGGIAKGLFRGIKDILPIGQLEDAINDVKRKKIFDLLQRQDKSADALVKEVLDILDDGKINQSYNAKKAEVITRLVVGGVPAATYIIYGLITGDWTFFF